MTRRFFKKFIFNKLNVVVTFCLLTLAFYNNCAPVNKQKGLTSADPVVRGKTLYSINCSSCHGDFKSSDIEAKTSTDIHWAIDNIGPLTILRSRLSEENITDLDASLQDVNQ